MLAMVFKKHTRLLIPVIFACFIITYSDFAEKAIAENLDSALAFYQQGNIQAVVESLEAVEPKERSLAVLFLLAKSYGQLKDSSKSLESLEALEKKLPENLSDIILYEKLQLFQQTGDKRNALLSIVDHPTSFGDTFISDLIAGLLIEDYKDFSDRGLLKKSLERLMPLSPEYDQAADVLRLYLSTSEQESEGFRDIQLAIWKLEDVEMLSENEKHIGRYVKANLSEYLDEALRHFQNQRRYRNYTYMTQAIPRYLNLIKDKKSSHFVELRELYFYAMARKKQFSRLVSLMTLSEKRKSLGLEEDEAMERQFDYLLRKGDAASAIDVLNKLLQKVPQKEMADKFLALADYYQSRNLHKQALYFFNRLKPLDSNSYDLSQVQWKIWRSYFLMNNREEMKKIADWAKSYEFSDNELGARFCYWGHKLKLYQEGSLSDCYSEYPITYYGLHSKYQGEKPDSEVAFNIPVSLVTGDTENIPENEQEQLALLGVMYQIGNPELADFVVRTKLSTANSSLLLSVANLLLEAERYFMVQLVVESRFRKVLENSLSGRKILLPYFFPLAYENEISQIKRDKNVPKPLIFSVMREESHFNPTVKSVAGAVGLMQLMPKTAKYIGKSIGMKVQVETLTKPEINLKLGTAYLERLMKRYNGNMFHTLAAYNGGPTNVKRWLKKSQSGDNDDFVESITFQETQNYVRRVMRTYYMYRFLYEQL